MLEDSIEILRHNTEFDGLIHAVRPLLVQGEPNSQNAAKWISHLSQPVNDKIKASDRVKTARWLLRQLKSNGYVHEPPSSTPRNEYWKSFSGFISSFKSAPLTVLAVILKAA